MCELEEQPFLENEQHVDLVKNEKIEAKMVSGCVPPSTH